MCVENERRVFLRCEVKRGINYRVAGDKYIHIAYIKNLGVGGLCFQSSEGIEEGAGIDIEFELPESLDRIVATGVVIWSNVSQDEWVKVFEVGVNFTRISDENRRKIIDYLERFIRRASQHADLPSGDERAKKTLLIVDGDPETLDAMRTLLKPYYSVLTASSCSEAVELTLRRSPDVVLVDLMMPDDDGLNVLKILKSKDSVSSIPVIMMSVIKVEKKVAEAEKLGAVAFISKPFKIDDLNRKIVEIVPHR